MERILFGENDLRGDLSVGRLEAAHRSTLYLERIDLLAPALQTKLLRLVTEGCFERWPTGEVLRVDVRIIAAGDLRLFEAVERGAFSRRLFDQLSAMVIRVPPRENERLDAVAAVVEEQGIDAGLQAFERALVARALDRSRGNIRAAARALKLNESTLRYRLDGFGLD